MVRSPTASGRHAGWNCSIHDHARTDLPTSRTFSARLEPGSIPRMDSAYLCSPASLTEKCLATSCLRGCVHPVGNARVPLCSVPAYGAHVFRLGRIRGPTGPGRTRSNPLRPVLSVSRQGLVAEDLADSGKLVGLAVLPKKSSIVEQRRAVVGVRT